MRFNALVGTFLLLSLACCDRVTVKNASGAVGLLVDGQGTPDPVNDFRLRKTGTGSITFRVGNYTSAATPNRNEVIGFGAARAPTRTATPWTPNNDSFDMDLENPVAVDITFWIVQGPANAVQFRIANATTYLESTWADERAGLVLGDVAINDLSSQNLPNSIRNFSGENWASLDAAVGFVPARLNVYWVNTVDGGMNQGKSDFEDHVVIGFEGGDHLVGHEVGHALGLFHPGEAGVGQFFDAQNVMTASSFSRRYLTEGQTFRAHFEPDNLVNRVLGARPGQPVEPCDPGLETPPCPHLNRRIWEDGSSFPPN